MMLEINVTYPWTGTFIDEMIEKTLGAKSVSSGCGQGERDMQFRMLDTLGTRSRIERLRKQPGVKATIRD